MSDNQHSFFLNDGNRILDLKYEKRHTVKCAFFHFFTPVIKI